jgi:predicted small lipoprotein YifL
MKKIISFGLVLVLTFSLAGCFGRKDNKPNDAMTMPSSNYTTEPTSRPTTQSTVPSTAATIPATTEATIPGSTDNATEGASAGK